MTPRTLARATVTAALVAAVTGAPGGSVAAAGAAGAQRGCGHGVTVVVEYNELDGHDIGACETGGGDSASELLERTGLTLTYVQRQPGFICRLSGLPEQDPCVNTPPEDAYWSLWWSDGSSGRWTYAAIGPDSLRIPEGGSVAMVWDGHAGDVQPATSPTAAASTPTTQARGSSVPSASRNGNEGGGDDGGVPGWVAPSAIGLLFVAAAATAVVRRGRGDPAP